MIKIGELELPTIRPADLDAQLVAATGCGESEIDLILRSGNDRVARALRPWLAADAPDHTEIARAVAADPGAAIDAIRALYATPVDADPVVADPGLPDPIVSDLTDRQPSIIGYDHGGADLHGGLAE